MTLAVNNAAGKLITTKDLNTIPVQRNYKTNVTGNLLTVDGTVKVTVKPTFTLPDLSENVKEVALVSEVTEALKPILTLSLRHLRRRRKPFHYLNMRKKM